MREQVLALRKEILGDKHPNTIYTMWGLANSLSNLGQYQEALSLQEQVLALFKEILGEKHPDTISAMNGLAWDYFLCRRFIDGIPYAEEVIKSQDENININERSRIEHLDTLALLYAETGNIDKALEIAASNLDIVKKSYASNKRNLASRYYAMAYCLNKAKRYDEALKHAEQAYMIRKEQIGEDKKDTITAKELLDEIKNHI